MKLFGVTISFDWLFRKSMKKRLEDALYDARKSYLDHKHTANHYTALADKDEKQISWLLEQIDALEPRTSASRPQRKADKMTEKVAEGVAIVEAKAPLRAVAKNRKAA